VCALAKERQPSVDDAAMLVAFKRRFKSDPWDTTYAVEVTQWRTGHWAAALNEQGVADGVSVEQRGSGFVGYHIRRGGDAVAAQATGRRRWTSRRVDTPLAHVAWDRDCWQELAAALQKCFDDTRLADFPFIAGTKEMVDALTAAGIAIVIITNGHHFVRALPYLFSSAHRAENHDPRRWQEGDEQPLTTRERATHRRYSVRRSVRALRRSSSNTSS
jgi:hypothetical protein